jgi:RNA polymerase sigma-70 factor (ECF subfamily)
MNTDAELVRQALAGRAEAYADLARRWAGRITALCHAKVGRGDVADDLAQETLLRGYRALRSLSAPDKFGSWLCGIAVRASLDWLKAKQRTQIPFSVLGTRIDGFPSTAPAADERLEHYDERRTLLAEVEALPEAYRQAVMLYYYDDLSYRDLAQLLGVSTATINARLTKARALLRQRLETIAAKNESGGPRA